MTSYSNNYPGIKNNSDPSGKSTLNKITVIFLLALAVIISSCEEKPSIIGMGLLPGGDFVDIESTDTIKPLSYTYYADSVRSNMKTYAYLGGVGGNDFVLAVTGWFRRRRW